jgi:tRNA-2-methylthio-N6-dimethylallyladenosine synthase
MKANTKRLHMVTWGCQMNVYDSGRMADVLAPLGYAPVDKPDGADLVILNTCHIREKASEKVFSELGRLYALKRERATTGGKMLLAVAGCVAQAEGEDILVRAPFVDIVVGPHTYHRLPELISRAAGGEAGIVDTDHRPIDKFDRLPESGTPPGPVAFLTIQEGCDKVCSFCVVPFTRGREQSRPASAVVAEARRLVAIGAREIALLGQNVNAWHGKGVDGQPSNLARLLREVASIAGVERLRYTTSHPCDMDDELIAAHGAIPALMPFLHLPVQSGSDRMLAAMRRRHTADQYRRIVDRLRTARPDIAISSDFIVGHPGETDADYEATLRLVQDVGFAQAYSFKYSSRPGTAAARAREQVPDTVKDARLQGLQALLRAQQSAFNADCVGRAVDVLFTGPGRHHGQIVGRSPWLQPVHTTGSEDLIGRMARVKIAAAHPNSLAVNLLAEELAPA